MTSSSPGTKKVAALTAGALGVAVAGAALVGRLRRVTDLVEESEDYEAENQAIFVVDDPPGDGEVEPNPEERTATGNLGPA